MRTNSLHIAKKSKKQRQTSKEKEERGKEQKQNEERNENKKARRKGMAKFLEEVGDNKIPNPNKSSTSSEVKIRSLQGTEDGEKILDDLYSKWKKENSKDKEEKPESKDDGEKDDKEDKPSELSDDKEEHSPVEEFVSTMDAVQFSLMKKVLKDMDEVYKDEPNDFEIPDEVKKKLHLPDGVFKTMGDVRDTLKDEKLEEKLGKPNLSERETKGAEGLAESIKKDSGGDEDKIKETLEGLSKDLGALSDPESSDEDRDSARDRLTDYVKEHSPDTFQSSGSANYEPSGEEGSGEGWISKFFNVMFGALAKLLGGSSDLLKGVSSRASHWGKMATDKTYRNKPWEFYDMAKEDWEVLREKNKDPEEDERVASGCTPCAALQNYAEWEQKFSESGNHTAAAHMRTAMLSTLIASYDEGEQFEELRITAEEMDNIDGPKELSALYTECMRTKGNRDFCARLSAEAFLTAYPDHPFADDLLVCVGESKQPTLIMPPRKPSDFLKEGQYLWALREDSSDAYVVAVEEVTDDYVLLSELDNNNDIVDEFTVDTYALEDLFQTGKLATHESRLGQPRTMKIVGAVSDDVSFKSVLALARIANTNVDALSALKRMIAKAKMDESAESVIVWLALPDKLEAVVRNLSKRVATEAKENDIKVITKEHRLEPHLTLLYIGDEIEEDDIPEVTRILTKIVSATTTQSIQSAGISYFDTDEHAVCKIGFTADWLDEVHWRFRVALEDAGFKYAHSFPRLALHATLQYLEPKGRVDVEFEKFGWTPDELHISHADGTDDVAFAKPLKQKTADRLPGGLADDKISEDFDVDSLEKGRKVEMEHTTDEELAREIAMDHLTEDPDYYDKLEVMEADGGKLIYSPDVVVDTDEMRMFFDDYINNAQRPDDKEMLEVESVTMGSYMTVDFLKDQWEEYVASNSVSKSDFRDVEHKHVTVIDRGATGKNWSYVACPRCDSVATQHLKKLKDAATDNHAPFQCRGCSQYFEIPRFAREKLRKLSNLPDEQTVIDDFLRTQYVQPHHTRQKPKLNPKSKEATSYEEWTDDEASQFVEVAESIGFGHKRRPSKMEWKKIFKKNKSDKRPKRWECCTKPVRGRDRKLKVIWTSNCRYRTTHGTRVMKRVVGRDMRPPKKIMLNKKRVQWCKGKA